MSRKPKPDLLKVLLKTLTRGSCQCDGTAAASSCGVGVVGLRGRCSSHPGSSRPALSVSLRCGLSTAPWPSTLSKLPQAFSHATVLTCHWTSPPPLITDNFQSSLWLCGGVGSGAVQIAFSLVSHWLLPTASVCSPSSDINHSSDPYPSNKVQKKKNIPSLMRFSCLNL